MDRKPECPEGNAGRRLIGIDLANGPDFTAQHEPHRAGPDADPSALPDIAESHWTEQFCIDMESLMHKPTEAIHSICEIASDAFMYLAQVIAEKIDAIHAVCEVSLIIENGTRKEIHYFRHGRKARTRKKYKNRILRRVRRSKKLSTDL